MEQVCNQAHKNMLLKKNTMAEVHGQGKCCIAFIVCNAVFTKAYPGNSVHIVNPVWLNKGWSA